MFASKPALALLALMFCIAGCDRQPELAVNGETLRGEWTGDTDAAAVFRGVPFAEPPLGELRWRAPQPFRARMTKRDATRFADACMQTPRILEWYRDMAEMFGASRDVFDDLSISEDCLYLNIWTPSLERGTSQPVMVYVHGGSNSSGWSYEPNYHGHVLAAQGVVLVSIAYRVGVFGFFSHPDLNANEISANFGLWDQVAALRWIQEHIGKFGGDPGRVTLFGESAGAQNIVALMFTDEARGLFHRAILQSTAGFGIGDLPTLQSEQARGVALAQEMRADSMAALRNVDADRLLDIYTRTFPDYYHAPAVDGRLITKPTWVSVHEAASIPFSVIVGTNADEWWASTPENATSEDVAAAAAQLRNIDPAAALGVLANEKDPRKALDRLRTADTMLCPSQKFAARVDAAGESAWMYLLSRVREGAAGAAVRAYHGAELPYVFGTHDDWLTTTATDESLSGTMMAYWTRFAASGNPNDAALPSWPRYGSPDYPAQEFGDEVRTISAPEPDLCKLFRASGQQAHR